MIWRKNTKTTDQGNEEMFAKMESAENDADYN